jgi:hypothetical protein
MVNPNPRRKRHLAETEMETIVETETIAETKTREKSRRTNWMARVRVFAAVSKDSGARRARSRERPRGWS